MSVKSGNGNWFGLAMLVLVVTGLCGSAASAEEQATATEQLKELCESARSLDKTDIARVRELIDAGADVNVKNKFGVTPLWIASQNGHTATVTLLLAANKIGEYRDVYSCINAST